MTDRPNLLITGASRGIGAATARLAAARGFDLALNYRSDAAAAEAVAAECRAAGARVETVQGDMAAEADIDRLFETVDRRLGRLGGLVNNAGITGRASRFDEAPPATIRACIDLNVTGALLVARQAIRRMARRHGGGGGAIVNVSSAASTIGSPGEFVWYAASKGAIDSLTLGLSKEFASEGIRINAVAPGVIDTEIHASGGQPDRVFRVGPLIPAGRVGTAEEVAETILFLLSDASSYVTGAVLRVAGGR